MIAENIILKKKNILIYGYGSTGKSAFKFLIKRNFVMIYDDGENAKDISKKNFYHPRNSKNITFDFILLSPGVNINSCKLNKLLKRNKDKIISDLDVFYLTYPKNLKITITGTNGKSTTCKLLYDILKFKKKDVHLIGNIGRPVLSKINIKKNSIFVIEASSYQLEYSKFFKTDIAAILNLRTDHLERHGNLRNYAESKIKLITSQDKKGISFVSAESKYLLNILSKKKFNTKIIKVKRKLLEKYKKKIINDYLMSKVNQKNLVFIFNICKFLDIKLKDIISPINFFKGLKYRQQTIFSSKNLKIVNDSKSTSFSSTENLIDPNKETYWILGGLPKKGDNFSLRKKSCKILSAYIFGKNRNFFENKIKNKVKLKKFVSLQLALNQALKDIKAKEFKKSLLLFSPASASFENFKNFEYRGKYFEDLIKKRKLK